MTEDNTYCCSYFKDEDTERLNNKVINYRASISTHKVFHSFNDCAILSCSTMKSPLGSQSILCYSLLSISTMVHRRCKVRLNQLRFPLEIQYENSITIKETMIRDGSLQLGKSHQKLTINK